jgi:hypothetical protein
MSIVNVMSLLRAHHDLQMQVRDLAFKRNGELCPAGRRHPLVVLDHLLWVSTVEDQLDDGLCRPALMLLRELNETIVNAAVRQYEASSHTGDTTH